MSAPRFNQEDGEPLSEERPRPMASAWAGWEEKLRRNGISAAMVLELQRAFLGGANEGLSLACSALEQCDEPEKFVLVLAALVEETRGELRKLR
jgi:hypothetical protein